MMDPDKLRLIYGNRDVIEVLEGLIAQAKRGELVAVACCTVEEVDGHNCQNLQLAWHDDLAVPWARIVASVAAAQHDLLAQGI